MLAEIGLRVRNGSSFAFETTLSGHGYARMIPGWRDAGYYVKLIFLNLPTPDLAVARVTARVAQGGIMCLNLLSAGALIVACGTSGNYTVPWLIDGSGTIIQLSRPS
ncbi:MAG: hypothetical protein ACR2G5_09185, partial [Pyrinomonadaceae bacterium]